MVVGVVGGGIDVVLGMSLGSCYFGRRSEVGLGDCALSFRDSLRKLDNE
jgi:hypothetical protein